MNAAVTGIGMVSALAHDVVSACAAARAGIRRARELEYFEVRSPADGSISGVLAHPVPVLTEGFEGFARLLRLVQAGLADLAMNVAPTHPNLDRATVYLALPLWDREQLFTASDEDESSEPIEKTPIDPAAIMTLAERLMAHAGQALRWRSVPSVRFATASGHTGVAEAVREALSDLQHGKVRAAIVGGVDSLLEERSLGWLSACERLKTPTQPAGLEPGEAAAFFLLEREAPADGHALGRIPCLGFGEEPDSIASGRFALGDGLIDAVRDPLVAAVDTAPAPWLIADQNGETYRAHEWGCAQMRLLSDFRRLESAVVWYPAVFFGDTGAASAAVATCMALRAFARGYAPAQVATVVSTSESTARAAFNVTAPI